METLILFYIYSLEIMNHEKLNSAKSRQILLNVEIVR